MAGKPRRPQADRLLIAALARGASVARAARDAGISERSAFRRLADPKFRQVVDEARAGLLERAGGSLADGADRAARELKRLLRSPSDAIRLGAARALVEFATKVRDAIETERRLVSLEQRMTNSANVCGTSSAVTGFADGGK